MGRMKELYTERETADYFGWSVFTMREIRKRGEIEHLLFNKKTVRYVMHPRVGLEGKKAASFYAHGFLVCRVNAYPPFRGLHY